MNPHETLIQTTDWIGTASLHASILVAMVVTVQFVLRRWLTPGWRYALWIPVLVRLLCPVFPESALSVFNLLPDKFETTTPSPQTESETPLTTKRRQTRLLPSNVRANIVHQPTQLPPPSAEDLPRPTWSSGQLLAYAWLLGTTVCGALMLIPYLRHRRRIGQLPVIDEPRVIRLWDEAKATLGVRSRVQLLATEADHSPALFGLTRVRLLLPRGLGERFSDAQLRHIFLHECAHLKRRDLPMNWLLAAIQSAHWFNPILWWAWSRARADREYACDALALRHSRDEPGEYGETLIQLVERAAAALAQPGMVGIGERIADLARRVRMIASFGRRRSRWGVLLLCIVCVGTLTSAVGNRSHESKTSSMAKLEEDRRPTELVFPFRAVDAISGDGIAEASIELKFMKRGGMESTQLRTATDGRCRARLPEGDLVVVTATCKKEGFAPLVYHSAVRHSPAMLVFELRRAVSGGGRILDPHRLPVVGASVRLIPDLRPGKSRDTPLPELMNHVFQTNEEGRWNCAQLEDDPDSSYRVTFRHRTQVQDHPLGESPATRVSLAALRNGDHILYAKTGGRLRGIVIDDRGEPVAGAHLVQRGGDTPMGHSEQTTEIDGSFEFPHAVGRPGILVASAAGFAPAQIRFNGRMDMPRLTVTLPRAVPLRGKVLDESDNPIAGVYVRLTHVGTTPVFVRDEPTFTDSAGSFVYSNAPPGDAEYGFSKNGYQPVQHRVGRSRPETSTFRMASVESIKKRQFAFHGRVVDAESSIPLRTFTVQPGVRLLDGDERPESTSWIPGVSLRVTGGRWSGLTVFGETMENRPGHFRFVIRESLLDQGPCRFRITAPGYRPFDTEWVKPATNASLGTIRLNRTPKTDSPQISLPPPRMLRTGDRIPSLSLPTTYDDFVETRNRKGRRLFLLFFSYHAQSWETLNEKLRLLGKAGVGRKNWELVMVPVGCSEPALELLNHRFSQMWTIALPGTEQLRQLGFGDERSNSNNLPGFLQVKPDGIITGRGSDLDLANEEPFALIAKVINGTYKKPQK